MAIVKKIGDKYKGGVKKRGPSEGAVLVGCHGNSHCREA